MSQNRLERAHLNVFENSLGEMESKKHESFFELQDQSQVDKKLPALLADTYLSAENQLPLEIHIQYYFSFQECRQQSFRIGAQYITNPERKKSKFNVGI